MPYVDIAGVECYYEKAGSGDPVLLVHGGFCSIETMRPQIQELAKKYEVHAPERPGHGRSPDRGGPLTQEMNVVDTIAYLDAAGLESVHLIGFSDGAIVGLLMAIHHPQRLRSLVAISGNLDPGAMVAPEQRERAMSPAAMASLSAEHSRLAPDGGAGTQDLMGRLMRMWSEEPNIDPSELDSATAATLVMAGDHDMVRLEHSAMIAERMRGQLCIIPAASHMLMLERANLVNLALTEFLATQ